MLQRSEKKNNAKLHLKRKNHREKINKNRAETFKNN